MTGILAAFGTEPALRDALGALRAEGLSGLEIYTPIPVEERPAGSPVPLAMFVAGVAGFIGFFALMSYADLVSYPLDIGGRPLFAWPAFVPIAFELAVLCAMFAGLAGYFIAGRLLRLHDPVDECDSFRSASRDGFLVAIRDSDPVRLAHARAVLRDLAPAAIEDIP